jgi:hypothetical protein
MFPSHRWQATIRLALPTARNRSGQHDHHEQFAWPPIDHDVAAELMSQARDIRISGCRS